MARLVFTEKDHNAYDPKKYKVVHKNHWRQVSLLLQPSNKKWWEDPDVIVAIYGGSVALTPNGAGAAAGAAIQLRFFAIAVAIIFYCIHQIVRRTHKVWPCHSQKYFHGN